MVRTCQLVKWRPEVTIFSQNASDQGWLVTGRCPQRRAGGDGDRRAASPETVLADAGYSNERDLADLETPEAADGV